MGFGALIGHEPFNHYDYNFNPSWPPEISTFKILISTIISLILMINKKAPNFF